MRRKAAVMLAALVALSLVAGVPAASGQATINGGVNVSLSPASDGSTATWSLSDYDSASNVTINITGETNYENDTKSGSLSPNGSTSLSVASDLEPLGHSQTEPQLTISGISPTYPYNIVDGSGDGNVDYPNAALGDDSSNNPYSASFEFSPNTDINATSVRPNLSVKGGGYDIKVDVYIDSGQTDSTFGEGTQVANNYDLAYESGVQSIKFDTAKQLTAGNTYEVEIITTNTDNDGAYDSLKIQADGSATTTRFVSGTGTYYNYEDWADIDIGTELPVKNLTVSDGASTTKTIGNIAVGETKQVGIDLSQTSNKLNFSADSGPDSMNYTIEYRERTQTTDSAIEINGNWANVSGSLADGSTTTKTIDKSALQQGTNRLNVSLGDGSLSADAPPMQADISITHDASDDISLSYNSSQFESSYNISHTYADATSNASATIPYGSSRVVAVHSLEYQINNNGWQSVSPSNYEFSGSTVSVDLSGAYGGELPSGATAYVRSTGRKIETVNGSITVTDPSKPGDPLDSQIKVNSRSPGFHINVGPTESGSRVHYATSNYYDDQEYSIIEANGDNQLYLPNAKVGDKARVKHLKTKVMPDRGDVRISVEKAGSEPKLDIDPGPAGSGDPVTYKYYRAQSGSEYLLFSTLSDIVLDSDEANSPAILEDDDSDDVLQILLDSDGGSGGGSSTTGGVMGPVMQDTGFDIPVIGDSILALLGLAVAALAGVSLMGRGGVRDDLRDSVPVVGGLLAQLAALLTSLARSLLGGGFRAIVSGAEYIRRRPTIGGIIGVGALLVALATGAISLPSGTTILILVPSFALVSYIGLRRLGYFSIVVWSVAVGILTLLSLIALGIEFGGLINQQTSVILAVGGLYLAYRLIQALQAPESTTELIINANRGNGGDEQ